MNGIYESYPLVSFCNSPIKGNDNPNMVVLGSYIPSRVNLKSKWPNASHRSNARISLHVNMAVLKLLIKLIPKRFMCVSLRNKCVVCHNGRFKTLITKIVGRPHKHEFRLSALGVSYLLSLLIIVIIYYQKYLSHCKVWLHQFLTHLLPEMSNLVNTFHKTINI